MLLHSVQAATLNLELHMTCMEKDRLIANLPASETGISSCKPNTLMSPVALLYTANCCAMLLPLLLLLLLLLLAD